MRKPLCLLLTLAAASLPASASPGVIDLPSGNFSASAIAPQKPVRTVEYVADGIIVREEYSDYWTAESVKLTVESLYGEHFSLNKIPYVRQGNYYYDTNISNSRIVGWQNMGHSHATVDVMISPYDKGKRAEVLIVDMTTGNFISNNPVNTNITGEKQSIPVICNGGLMTASLMVNGYPVSNVKIYVK